MRIKEDLSIEDFYVMFELEKQFYSVDCITPPMESYRWYLHFKRSFLVVEVDGLVVGFMCLFPVSNEVRDLIEAGCFNDASLEFTDIINEEQLKVGDTYTLFLSCVLIDSSYRQTSALKLLLNGYKAYYARLEARGIWFDDVLSDNVTEAGLQFSSGLGLSPVIGSDHESMIVKGTYKEVMSRIRA
ncbi:MAG TPA: hypothetical protein DCY20_01100 [Firmicutes bacterium]|nr:hypothetical protein [Bacillota bacterium]